MNKSNPGPSPMPTPLCAAYAPLLPLLAGSELSAEDATATRTHLATCAWCQSQLAMYDVLDVTLRRHYSNGEHTTYFLSMEDVMSDFKQDAHEITQPVSSPLHTSAAPGRRPPYSPSRRLSVIGAVAAVLLIALFAGTIYALHGRQSGQPIATATATSTIAPTATTVPTATPLPEGASACGKNGGTPLTVSKIHFGRYGEASYEYYVRLADDLALRPQVMSQSFPDYSADVALTDTAHFDLEIPAPPASQPGYICAVTVRIVSFQPLSSHATNIYRPCVGQFYSDPGGWLPSSPCPAAAVGAGSGTVTLPTTDVGASVTGAINGYTASFQPSNQPAVEPPPPAGPGQPGATDVVVGIKVPQAGTYTFAISLWQDRSGPSITMPDVTLQFLLGQALHEWGGQQCTTPDMQSQLPPPTDPPTHLICPGPPPQ